MSLELNGPILLAGAGKMGGALLAGWLTNGVPAARILVQDPHLAAETAAMLASHGIVHGPELGALAEPPAAIVVAVKPQMMETAFPQIAALAGPKTVVMSIAAGKSIANFANHLQPGAAIVRAMPNTPAAIGRGITGAVANSHVTPAQKALCERLLQAGGEVVWLEDEEDIDAVTAVSGSGPAYVFLLVEVMAAAGCAAGLAPDVAMRLARATVSGSGELLARSTEDAATLRKNVTSPGGTTAAALAVLMRDHDGLQALMTEAIAAAKNRGRELGK